MALPYLSLIVIVMEGRLQKTVSLVNVGYVTNIFTPVWAVWDEPATLPLCYTSIRISP